MEGGDLPFIECFLLFLSVFLIIFLFAASTWSDGGSVRPSYWLVLHNLTPQVTLFSYGFLDRAWFYLRREEPDLVAHTFSPQHLGG